MSITGIKEIDFEQAYLGKAIPREKLDRYIPKDSVLNLGNVKIKLKASEKLQTVIQKINIHSHSTGIRAKSVRGALVLEAIGKGNSRYGSMGITLREKNLGIGNQLDANQIIAQYLASLPTKVSTGIQVWDEAENNLYLLNELPQIVSNEENNNVESKASVNYSINSEEFNNNFVIFNENEIFSQVPEPIYSNINSYNNSLNTTIVNAPSNYLSQIMIEHISNLTKDNCEAYWKSLNKKQRVPLENHIRMKIKNYNIYGVIKPHRNAQLLDKFYFCIIQIKAGNMPSFHNS